MPTPFKEIKVMWKKILAQTCGVGEVGYFRYEGDNEAYGDVNIQNVKIDKEVAGCGWIIVSFTPHKQVYKDAYAQLVERFGQPVFQSDVRVNERTSNKFFFCIFDTKGKK